MININTDDIQQLLGMIGIATVIILIFLAGYSSHKYFGTARIVEKEIYIWNESYECVEVCERPITSYSKWSISYGIPKCWIRCDPEMLTISSWMIDKGIKKDNWGDK